MDFLGRSARFSKLDTIRNGTIREKINFNETIMQFVGNKQLQWFGHVKRAEDRLPVRSLEWVPNGRKRRGTPKKTWIEGIMNLIKDRGLQDGDWEDREEWRMAINS